MADEEILNTENDFAAETSVAPEPVAAAEPASATSAEEQAQLPLELAPEPAQTPQAEAPAAPQAEAPAAPPAKRRRGRPRKNPLPEVDAMTQLTQSATQASSEPTPFPATTLAEVPPAAEAVSAVEEGEGAAPAAGRRRRRSSRAAATPSETAPSAPAPEASAPEAVASPAPAPTQQTRRNEANANGRRRNRRGGDQQTVEPSLSRDELAEMKVGELRAKASELGIDTSGVRKAELVEMVFDAAAIAEGFRPVDGILEIGNEGYGWVRTGNYMEGDNDGFVHQQLIKSYGLRSGDRITGKLAPGRAGNKYPPLQTITLVNGKEVDRDALKARPRFRDLTPIFPNERLVLENGKDSITGRAIDLVAPIGKGQRGLIVSPPKAGKTTVLKRICQSITANNPEVHLFCLLVDERPEEVTDMQRSIKGTVVASTFDQPAENHTAVSELVIEHAKRLVEQGEDVVVVLDSITRLARAYNLAQPASGRILSGGVDSAALYPPKKFLGAARNIEGGGSLTIIASALIDTGSKMDEVIFEEFKGTGNMELKLDRDLADRRIYPAIDPVASGTRNEDLLIDPELQPFIWGIRRILANMNNTERAATALVKGLQATRTNEEFLIRSAKKAQQQDFTL